MRTYFSRVFKWYSNNLIKRPYATQIVTSGVLWTTADFLTQKFVEGVKEIDYNRLRSTSLYGTVIAGPLFCWYDLLDRNTRSMVGKVGPTRFILTKIFLDQFLFEPFNLTIYYFSTNLLEGKSVKESFAALRRDFVHAFCADTLMWPPMQFLNFKYIPVHFQALYVNQLSLVWAGFLSWLNHRSHETVVPSTASTSKVLNVEEKLTKAVNILEKDEKKL